MINTLSPEHTSSIAKAVGKKQHCMCAPVFVCIISSSVTQKQSLSSAFRKNNWYVSIVSLCFAFKSCQEPVREEITWLL